MISGDQPADLSADAVTSLVRVHADRVHDAVRRLGCDQATSVHVVETAALELVEAAVRAPSTLVDPVGWLFARARALGRGNQTDDDALPVGGGVLGGDDAQMRLAEALEMRPARDRAALLLRDSYQLPIRAVATMLGSDTDTAHELVGAARLAFLPALTGGPAPTPSGHVPLAALARLAEGGPAGARESTARRHVQGCAACAAVLDAQERARRLLTGLTVVALPDADRERILAEVGERARAALPAGPPPAAEVTWIDEPHRPYSLSLMALGLVLAVGVGLGLGALLGRDGRFTALGRQDAVPLVTAVPVLTAAPPPSASGKPSTSPSPRVYAVTPSPTPTPSATASASATATATAVPLTLQLDPASGPANTQLTVTGQGWLPGADLVVRFLNQVGGQAGATVGTVVDDSGAFVVTLTAHDDNNLPGPHTVTADDGTNQSQATFTITG